MENNYEHFPELAEELFEWISEVEFDEQFTFNDFNDAPTLPRFESDEHIVHVVIIHEKRNDVPVYSNEGVYSFSLDKENTMSEKMVLKSEIKDFLKKLKK